MSAPLRAAVERLRDWLVGERESAKRETVDSVKRSAIDGVFGSFSAACAHVQTGRSSMAKDALDQLDALLAAHPEPGEPPTPTWEREAVEWVRARRDPWKGLTADDKDCHCLFCEGEFAHTENCLWARAHAPEETTR